MSLFNAYFMWLDDPVVTDSNLHVPSLAPCFLPDLLQRTLAKDCNDSGGGEVWYDYVKEDDVGADFGQQVKDWQRLHFRTESSNARTRQVNSKKLMIN